LKQLNERYTYGIELILLSIDEGITGYRDDSLETVKRNQISYNLPLKVVTYEELYGWTMDEIVKKVGRKNNCKNFFNYKIMQFLALILYFMLRYILWRF